MGLIGKYNGINVYKFKSIEEYLEALRVYDNVDFYGVLNKRDLFHKFHHVGEVDSDGVVTIFKEPISVNRVPEEEDFELTDIDIELISIENIIDEIKKLHLSFD